MVCTPCEAPVRHVRLGPRPVRLDQRTGTDGEHPGRRSVRILGALTAATHVGSGSVTHPRTATDGEHSERRSVRVLAAVTPATTGGSVGHGRGTVTRWLPLRDRD